MIQDLYDLRLSHAGIHSAPIFDFPFLRRAVCDKKRLKGVGHVLLCIPGLSMQTGIAGNFLVSLKLYIEGDPEREVLLNTIVCLIGFCGCRQKL